MLASSAGNLIGQSPNIIRLRQNASVSVEATGQEGTAGDITFASRFLVLGDSSRLTSETESGNGGNISLSLQDALLLQDGSRISTSAGTIGNGGDGGNINLTLNNGYILAETWNSNTDITANAFNGSGGQITITTPGLFQLIRTRPIITEQLLRNSDPGNDFTTFIDGIFGLIPRSRSDLEDLLGTTNPAELDPVNLPSNDITAISQNNPNLSGEIIFQTPDLDPSQGTIELPSNFIDPLVTPTCEAQPRTESEYSITGQGGIPSSPDNPLTRDTLLDDLGPPSLVQDSAASSAHSEDIALPDRDRPIEIIEAQGLSIDADGNPVLVADTSSPTPQNNLHHHPNCTENLTPRSVSNLRPLSTRR